MSRGRQANRYENGMYTLGSVFTAFREGLAPRLINEGAIGAKITLDTSAMAAALRAEGIKTSTEAYRDYEQDLYKPSDRHIREFPDAFGRILGLNTTERSVILNAIAVKVLVQALGHFAWEHWDHHSMNTPERRQAFNDAIDQVRAGQRLPETDIPDGVLFLGLKATRGAIESE